MRKVYRSLIILSIFLCNIAAYNSAFALNSNMDLTLDDNSGDSPRVVLVDAADQQVQLGKVNGDGALLRTTQGPITIAPSGDVSKTYKFETASSGMTVSFSNEITNKPGIRLDGPSSKLGYRDQNSATWMNFGWKVSAKTADFNITADDDKKFFVVDNFTTATLPSAATVGADFMVSIKRMSTSDDVIIATSNSETIEGRDFLRLNSKSAKATLISDGSNWYIFEEFGTTFLYDNSGACPTGYISVPPNALYGITEDFCVAKYEMKNVTGIATSEPLGTPWVSISQTSAKTACTALGAGYHLITNDEWMTLARNIENVPTNWSGGSVGSGLLNIGHSDNSPANALAANADDVVACQGTGETCSNSVWSAQRRTHVLSNGQIIWDFAGNVWDWIDWNVLTDKASPGGGWIEINTATPTTSMPQKSFYPENATFNATQGTGRYYPSINGSGGAAIRGGDWYIGTSAGVFSLNLAPSPSYSSNSISGTSTVVGFRCAWSAGG